MTKFQRGELMEGWNDCPVPLISSRNSSSTSVSSAKSRRRMSRIVGTATDPAGARGPPPSAPSAPPLGLRTPLVASVIEPAALDAAADLDIEATGQKLRDIVSTSNVADADFFVKRLIEPYETLEVAHKEFVTRIAQGIEAKQSITALKAQVLKYMMINSGVSTWCVPLKKLVESQ